MRGSLAARGLRQRARYDTAEADTGGSFFFTVSVIVERTTQFMNDVADYQYRTGNYTLSSCCTHIKTNERSSLHSPTESIVNHHRNSQMRIPSDVQIAISDGRTLMFEID